MRFIYWAKELTWCGFPGNSSLEGMLSDGCPKGLDLKNLESAVSTNPAITVGEPSAEFSVSHPNSPSWTEKDLKDVGTHVGGLDSC